MTCGIYLIENTVSPLFYIGQAKNISARWHQHRYVLRGNTKRANRALRASWMKYGESAFKFSVLEECPVSELTARESFWIAKFREGGFRVANTEGPSDNPMRGQRHSQEAREKIGAAQRGVPKSAIHRQRIGAAQRGRVLCVMVREKIAASKRGKPNRHWQRHGNPSVRAEHRQRMKQNNPASDPRVRAVISRSLSKPVACEITGQMWGSMSECATALGVSVARVSKAIQERGLVLRMYRITVLRGGHGAQS